MTMENKKITLAGTGCCLVDRIYNTSFTSPAFVGYLSKEHGDGGLVPGHLELEEPFEKFCGRKFPDVLRDITKGEEPNKVNIGGPCIVALINAAQLTEDIAHVSFYGCRSDDRVGEMLRQMLDKVPVDLSHYRVDPGRETASTTVFSDPDYDDGHGERIFVNTIGASNYFFPSDLGEDFFNSDIVMFGGTAIVPSMHAHLEEPLRKARSRGCLTIVTTVFDTINERRHLERWPLGASDDSYACCDLLIADRAEALRLSGTATIPESLEFFRRKGVGCAVVTNGSKDVWFYAEGEKFVPASIGSLPVSEAVDRELAMGRPKGDTTGCGDNFAGGVVASVIMQMHEGRPKVDVTEACCLGNVSGGFACFYYGGTFFETERGQKRALLRPYLDEYRRQIGRS